MEGVVTGGKIREVMKWSTVKTYAEVCDRWERNTVDKYCTEECGENVVGYTRYGVEFPYGMASRQSF